MHKIWWLELSENVLPQPGVHFLNNCSIQKSNNVQPIYRDFIGHITVRVFDFRCVSFNIRNACCHRGRCDILFKHDPFLTGNVLTIDIVDSSFLLTNVIFNGRNQWIGLIRDKYELSHLVVDVIISDVLRCQWFVLITGRTNTTRPQPVWYEIKQA